MYGQLSGLLKEGTRHISGQDDAVIKNIQACKEMSNITRTSMGPNGMNKLVINRLEKLYVTKDAATILDQIEVEHPAAKMLVLASQQQEKEVGDGTNLVLTLGGEVLHRAEELLRQGIHTSEVVLGYEKAAKKALEVLETLEVHKLDDLRDVEQVGKMLETSVGSKLPGYGDVLAQLIAEACVQVLPEKKKAFNIDNVRVAKVLGGSVLDSKVIRGFSMTRSPTSVVKHVTDAKVAVYSQGFDLGQTEAKGTVLLESADQLENFSKTEEAKVEAVVKGIADMGVKVIVSGGALGDMAQHFIDRYGLFSIRIMSKFQLRRLARTVRATPLVRLGVPTVDELGHADKVDVEEIGSTQVTTFLNTASKVSTIVVRGATQNLMDATERAVDDGVNVFKNMVKDARFVAGGGAAELEIARQLAAYGETVPGLEQYALGKAAEAFEIVARTLAENSGMNGTRTVASLYTAHANGQTMHGVSTSTSSVADMKEEGVFDLMRTKHWAIKFAFAVVVKLLRVDQIIMARTAGGPAPPRQGGRDA